MNLFIRVALSGSLLFTLLCAGAILIGQSNPVQPELFQYLSTCDGQPCYLGIVPGKTSWDDAVRILEDTPGMQFDPDTNVAANPPGFQGNVIVFTTIQDQTVVAGAVLDMRSRDFSFASVMEQFGSPCAAGFSDSGDLLIGFRDMGVLIYLDMLGTKYLLQPHTPIGEIILSNDPCHVLLAQDTGQHWKGFTHYTK